MSISKNEPQILKRKKSKTSLKTNMVQDYNQVGLITHWSPKSWDQLLLPPQPIHLQASSIFHSPSHEVSQASQGLLSWTPKIYRGLTYTEEKI